MGKENVSEEGQSVNAPELHDDGWIVPSNITVDNDEHLLNAYLPIYVTLFGIVIFVNDEQYINA